MVTSQQSLPSGGLNREEIAKRDLGHTTIAPATVWVLLVFFLMSIIAVPLVELTIARARSIQGVATAWSHLFSHPSPPLASMATPHGLWQRITSRNRIVLAALTAFERTLEDDSLIGRSLRPSAQLVMTRRLRAGNERVYPGRDGWLFYRPDVEYVTGRGFLERSQLRRRLEGAPEWETPPQPDPRVAIAQFKRDLDARGIALVLMPTPLKPGVHPERLARRYTGAAGVLHNPSYRQFLDDMRRDGVLVFDPSEALAAARQSEPQYLAADTHWRPETMESIATLAGDFIAAEARLPIIDDPGYQIERLEIQNRGDIARMLDLPEHANLFPPETVWLRRVLQSDGSPWRSSRDGDVLVLGDSFSNIYTLESMGWGTSAGFVEQLSYALRRPVDRLTQNDQGSFATRAMLQRDPSRLDGKRLVIYQFAARELTDGDWKVLKLPQ
jgi:hypothetical protein